MISYYSSSLGVITLLSVLLKEQFDALRDILEFYLDPGSKILDITYGHGKLWQFIGNGVSNKYQVISNDVDPGSPSQYHYSFPSLHKIPHSPYDCVLYDPPYKYNTSSFILFQRSDDDWRPNKTKWSISSQVQSARTLNNVLPPLLKENGLLIVKIMDTRYRGKLVLNHKIMLDTFSNFTIEDIIVYIRLLVGLFKNKKHSQTAHGYFMVFRVNK